MKHVLEFTDYEKDKAWLILGKGPSLRRIKFHDFNVASINQAIEFYSLTTLAFFTDLEPVLDIDWDVPASVVLPFYPHWNQQTQNRSLKEILSFFKILRDKDYYGELYSYDLLPSDYKFFPEKPPIRSYLSTAEVVVETLALMGQKHIYTLGIDGGSDRAPQFKNSYRTVEVPYDGQFVYLKALEKKYGLVLEKL